MRQWPRRFGETLFQDCTRQLQVLCVVAAFLVANWLWSYNVPADPQTARAVFYFLSERTFAVLLVVAGMLQLIAVAGPWWRLRFAAASIKWTVWVYATACFWLTNPDALALPLLITICLAEFWIGTRALQDKELNGVDRRVGRC